MNAKETHLEIRGHGAGMKLFFIALLLGLGIQISYAQSTVCAESFLTSAMNGDYGQAINAADQAASLLAPSTIKICAPGDHPVSTPIVFDRPIAFIATGSRLIPQSALGSTPVSLTGVTVTAGNKTIPVSSTTGLSVGMRVGGAGIPYGAVITAVGSSNITLSLSPNIVLTGFVTSGSKTITGLNSLVGVSTGQTITGYGIPASTKVSSINYGNLTANNVQSIVISQAATETQTLNGQRIPTSIALAAGSTWTTNLTAVGVIPVITWKNNDNALQNEFNQNIGGEMDDVWIVDKTNRGIQGIQGIQILGWDRFHSTNTTIEEVNGSGFIVQGWCASATACGRMSATRESFFYNTKIRYTGTETTGESPMEIMSGPFYPNSGEDENNQLGFSGGQLVDNYGEHLLIGTYNVNDTGANGPRLIWFSNNFQIESGNYLNTMASSQFDLVHIEQAGDVYFDGAELADAGYGKSVIRVDAVNLLNVQHSFMTPNSSGQSYKVSVTNGSPTVNLLKASPGQWVTNGSWNGIAGLMVDGGTTCTSASPCLVYLSPTNGVPNSTTLTLASPYAGTTNTTSAQITIPIAGAYGINATNPIYNLFTNDDFLSPGNFASGVLGFVNSFQEWYVGNGFGANPPYGMEQQYTGAMFIPQLSSNAFTTQKLYSQGQLTLRPGTSSYSVPITPPNDAPGDIELYGTNAAGSSVLWQITQGGVALLSGENISGASILTQINQQSTNKFAGVCTMSSSTSCTFTLGAGYASSPIGIASPQGGTAYTGGQASCVASGRIVTITAPTSNSLTWGCLLIGNPN